MAHRVSFLLYCISFSYIASRLLFCNLYFPICTTKIPKIFTLLSLLDLAFVSDREGIDNPFTVLVARLLIVCAGTTWLVRCLLLAWYLGSQNRGKYLRYFAASPFPLQGKTNACSRGSKIRPKCNDTWALHFHIPAAAWNLLLYSKLVRYIHALNAWDLETKLWINTHYSM